MHTRGDAPANFELRRARHDRSTVVGAGSMFRTVELLRQWHRSSRRCNKLGSLPSHDRARGDKSRRERAGGLGRDNKKARADDHSSELHEVQLDLRAGQHEACKVPRLQSCRPTLRCRSRYPCSVFLNRNRLKDGPALLPASNNTFLSPSAFIPPLFTAHCSATWLRLATDHLWTGICVSHELARGPLLCGRETSAALPRKQRPSVMKQESDMDRTPFGRPPERRRDQNQTPSSHTSPFPPPANQPPVVIPFSDPFQTNRDPFLPSGGRRGSLGLSSRAWPGAQGTSPFLDSRRTAIGTSPGAERLGAYQQSRAYLGSGCDRYCDCDCDCSCDTKL